MPKNKSYEDRKKILNQMFRTRPFTLDELINRVEERLEVSISKKTIQNDIRAIKREAEAQGAAVKCVNSRYAYEPKNFNLFEVNADPDAVARIKLAVAILRQIPGLDLHEDLRRIYDKLEMRLPDDDEKEFIQFDTRPDYAGAKYLAEILEAIKGDTVISFDYQSFKHEKPVRIIVHPYLLKEWNNRWFLVGLPENLKGKGVYEFHLYGLERIKSKIKPESAVEFYRHHKFDSATFYKNVIGVTIPKDEKVEKVVLRFSAARANYIETNPLHPSQKLLKKTKTHKTFTYDLILNPELQSIILSFGMDIEVLRPAKLHEAIVRGIKNLSKSIYN